MLQACFRKRMSGRRNSAVAHMEWLDVRWDSGGHLLAALHAPFAFVLWDTATGEKVWRKTYTETVQGGISIP